MASRGAQPGNHNATKAKPWSDAIRVALLAEDGKKLRLLADKLIEKALEGDIQALKEIGDRFEGKPAQPLTGPEGGPIEVDINDMTEIGRRVAFSMQQAVQLLDRVKQSSKENADATDS